NAHHRAITVNSLLQLVNRFYIYDVLTKQLNDNREVGTEMSKVYGHTVDRQTRCTHIIQKQILLLLNLNVVINIIRVINAIKNVKITRLLHGKRKNLMN